MTKKRKVIQADIIQKIIFYLNRNYDLKEWEGLCHGFSVVHAYMAAENALPWWYAVIDAISDWEVYTDPKDKIIIIPGYTTPYTLDVLLERASHYLLYNQGIDDELSMEKKQCNFLHVDGYFFSERGTIRRHALALGNFSIENIEKLLDKNLFDKKVLLLICSYELEHSHACSIRFYEKKWRLFDCNYSCVSELIIPPNKIASHIVKRLGTCLRIIVAAWNDVADAAIDQFEENFNNLFNTESISQLIDGHGFEHIEAFASENIPRIRSLIEKTMCNRAWFAKTVLNGSGPRFSFSSTHYEILEMLAMGFSDVRDIILQRLDNGHADLFWDSKLSSFYFHLSGNDSVMRHAFVRKLTRQMELHDTSYLFDFPHDGFVYLKNHREIREVFVQVFKALVQVVQRVLKSLDLNKWISDWISVMDTFFAIADEYADVREALIANFIKKDSEGNLVAQKLITSPKIFMNLLSWGKKHGAIREDVVKICMACFPLISKNEDYQRELKYALGYHLWALLVEGNNRSLQKFLMNQSKQTALDACTLFPSPRMVRRRLEVSDRVPDALSCLL